MALKKEFTVFLVDDDNMFLKMLEDNLANQKYKSRMHFKTFSSGEACLENLHLNPDLIILDYYMDKGNSNAMNGIQVLKKIKQRNPGQQVIMLSGQDKIEVAVETMKNGALDYLIKNESAFVRGQHVIKNIIKNITISELLKIYKFGFLFLLSLFIVIFGVVAILIVFFPETLQNYALTWGSH